MELHFPDNYADSRLRFRQAAGALGAELRCFQLNIKGAPDLSVDVALIGTLGDPAIVITSGLHGVEGPVGAAVQLAWLNAQLQRPDAGRFVLVHALNPYGYAMGRRANEDNVDLNRHFQVTGQDRVLHGGSTSDYARFNTLLNPAFPPRRLDGFTLQALCYLAREGRRRLQGAIVTGQYDFPHGLFYGGTHLSRTAKWIQEQIPRWLGDAPEVCHLDFHSGLGAFARCQLLVQAIPGSPDYHWYEQSFGAQDLVPTETADSGAYQARGAMGHWLIHYFADRPYRFVTAEFGTYSALKMLSALRAENQAHHYSPPGSAARNRARRRLERCFCPPSPGWRREVTARGLSLIDQARCALDRNL